MSLAGGAWGIVFEGRHRQLNREVAIKQLPEVLIADELVRARFQEEARILARLDHPHIVPVYDFVSGDGLCLLVMEKLTGGTVWSRFASAGLAAEEACVTALATCAALHCAHEHGVLHRDIKPENLMFSRQGSIKVTDFGIAKVIGGSETLATRGGDVLGTPVYMAPEQVLGEEPTPATDVYATGVMLYELLSGRLPFSTEGGAVAVMYRHAHEQPAPLAPAAPSVPGGIADVVMRALAKDPARRYASASDFGVALATATTGAWGAGWVERSSLSILSAGPVVAALEAAAAPAGQPVPVPAATLIHPSEVAHRSHKLRVGREKVDFVPVKELVARRPRAPMLGVLVAMAMTLLMVAAAFGGPTSRVGSATTAGTVAVNGVEVAMGRRIELDLTKPVVITGRARPGALRRVGLHFSVLGLPLSSAEAEAQQVGDGSFTASVDLSGSRYLVAGSAIGTVQYIGDAGMEANVRFVAGSTQRWFLTAPGAGVLALALFVLGYAESLMRSLRRRSMRVSGIVGMVMIGSLAGGVTVILAWVTGRHEPAIGTLISCATLGAGAGLGSALVASGVGRGRHLSQ